MTASRHAFFLAIVLASASTTFGDAPEPVKTQALTKNQSKPYAEKFWKEYSRKEVRKQICVFYGLTKEQAEDESAEIAVSMSGPHFFRDSKSGIVEGFLTIGAVGSFVVSFEEDKVTKSEFMESLTGKGKRLKTLQECHDVFSEMFPRLFKKVKPSTKDSNIAEDGTGQPATRPESKSEGGDKPHPDAERRSR